ncbi:MAG: hypoxanthine phosphoribosyltransferase [Thermodesulfobacteriota bacterium]|nr:hypoxanthine phosphoribosyltransferase [Thermodesulfobacteriota bacterium]
MDNKDQLREVLSFETIKARIHEMGEQISKDYHGRPIVLIGILNGAFIFMADLIRQIKNPLKIDFVRLASYGSQAESSGRISFTKDIELDIKNRDVLVVEDIVDTGYTLKYLKEVLNLHNPASVKICCLIDKKERRKVPIEVDYVGFDIPRGFLVGYGLDFDENYRNLPAVYYLNPGYKPEGFVPSDR